MAYAEHAMKTLSFFEQHRWFKEKGDVHDDAKSGQIQT